MLQSRGNEANDSILTLLQENPLDRGRTTHRMAGRPNWSEWNRSRVSEMEQEIDAC